MADDLLLDQPLEQQLGQPAASGLSGKASFAGAQLPNTFNARMMAKNSQDSSENDDDEDGFGEEDNGSESMPSGGGEEAGESATFDEDERAAQLEQGKNSSRQALNNAKDLASKDPRLAIAKQALSQLTSGKGAEETLGKATDGMLKSAWENLFISFLTTIVWIDIHVFLHFIGMKMFNKLGHEWSDVAGADAAKAKEITEKLNMPESMACCAVNGCCGMIIIGAIVQISFMVWVISDPWGVLTTIGGAIIDMFKGLFS